MKSRNDYVNLKELQEIPTKRISNANFGDFKNSEGYYRILDFLYCVNATIAENPQNIDNDKCNEILKILDNVKCMAMELDPIIDNSRYGSITFRDLISKIEITSTDMLKGLVPSHTDEIKVYFDNSFGDKSRIDYGSGHELNFICFLLCLHLLKYFDGNLYSIFIIFKRYIDVMRVIQKRYRLEPAGSHGVWGLDDFQFISFYWGSSELLNFELGPESVNDKNIVQQYKDHNLYYSSIWYILENKSGPFFEHSPILYDISGVPTWSKVNSGLMKMYLVEVLGKVVVAQHIFFGSLIPFSPADDIRPDSV